MGDMESFITFMMDNRLEYGICNACCMRGYKRLLILVSLTPPKYPHYQRTSMYYWFTPTLCMRQNWDLETIISRGITPRIAFLNFLYEQL